jgi:hypothetical protein
MDIKNTLKQLFELRQCTEEAILALERLDRGLGKRRGRPPAWLAGLDSEPVVSKAHESNAARIPRVRRAVGKKKSHTVDMSEKASGAGAS